VESPVSYFKLYHKPQKDKAKLLVTPDGCKIAVTVPTKPRRFEIGTYYHVYNCGVERRPLFDSSNDYLRFSEAIKFYRHEQKIGFAQYQNLLPTVQQIYNELHPTGVETLRVRIISHCLMPNHFHLVLKPVSEDGLVRFISDICNSHSRYFNTKYERLGKLFQGPFKAKEIKTDESLLQVTRYVHINPPSSKRTNPHGTLRPEDYPYSSYKIWISPPATHPTGVIVDLAEVRKFVKLVGGPEKYKQFVEAKLTPEALQDSLGELALDGA